MTSKKIKQTGIQLQESIKNWTDSLSNLLPLISENYFYKSNLSIYLREPTRAGLGSVPDGRTLVGTNIPAPDRRDGAVPRFRHR